MPAPLAERPAHLRFVATLLLVFYGVLALDYVALRLSLALPLPEVYVTLGFPAPWVALVWTAGVWLGLFAAALLFAGSRASVLVFVLVFTLMISTLIGVTGTDPILGLPRGAAWGLFIFVPVASWLYARTAYRQNQLH
jgi:hypothetical protein